MNMQANVITFPDFKSPAVPLDPENRKRLARYKAKKAALSVNPKTFFRLGFIRNV